MTEPLCMVFTSPSLVQQVGFDWIMVVDQLISWLGSLLWLLSAWLVHVGFRCACWFWVCMLVWFRVVASSMVSPMNAAKL